MQRRDFIAHPLHEDLPSRFVRSLAWMVSSDCTASLISRHTPWSMRPGTSVTEFPTESSPVKGRESEAWIVLNLVLDRGSILQPDSDLGGHLLGIEGRICSARPGRLF